MYQNVTNPDLWSACGVTTPGFCPSTLISQPTRSPNDSTTVLSTRVPTYSSQPTESLNDSTAVASTARVPTLSSQPTESPSDSTSVPSKRVPSLLSQSTRSPNNTTAVPSTTRVHTLSSQPAAASSTESNSALSLDSCNYITMILVLLVLQIYPGKIIYDF